MPEFLSFLSSFLFVFRIFCLVNENCVGPDHTPNSEMSDLGLRCLQKYSSIGKKLQRHLQKSHLCVSEMFSGHFLYDNQYSLTYDQCRRTNGMGKRLGLSVLLLVKKRNKLMVFWGIFFPAQREKIIHNAFY